MFPSVHDINRLISLLNLQATVSLNVGSSGLGEMS